MSWTEERIERLKTMWTEGATASQIADELGGVSRNAVIGKAHRLGLEARPSPVKPGEEKERHAPAAASAPAPKPAPAERAAPRATSRARVRAGGACAADPSAPAARTVRHPVSLDRPGRLHPSGPRRPAGADPAGSAAPPGSGQAEPGSRRQDQPARSQRPHLQMADGPSGRARLPLLRQCRRTRASPIASSIAASPTRRSFRAATAARPRRSRSADRASARTTARP